MFTNFSISQLSMQLLFLSPLISEPYSYQKTHFNSFNRIHCMKSFFSKFNGQCPIIMNSQSYNDHKNNFFYKNAQNNEEKDNYEGDQIVSTLFFYTNLDSSVTFQQCTFQDCVNDISQGGAISFRRSYSSLTIQNCIFKRCKSLQSSGAIFVLQLLDGSWLIGTVTILDSEFEECYDYNSEPNHDYIAGVIECSIAKGENKNEFLMQNARMINCEFPKENRITEAQIRLHSNIFHISNFNITNTNEKVDLSAIFFNKYVQESSKISFLKAFNQHGFSFFEIYFIESSFIEISNIIMVNTTFVNYNKDQILDKLAFFNIYFEHENSLFIDNFFIIDFTTVVTDNKVNRNYSVVQPVIIKIPENSQKPIVSNVFSNQIFDQTNLVNYTFIPSMKYDFLRDLVVGFPSEDKSSFTGDVMFPTEITVSHSNQFNFIINNISKKSENESIKHEVIIVLAIVLAIVVVNVAAIVALKIHKTIQLKNFSFQIDNNEDFGGDSNSEDSDEGNKKENAFAVDSSMNDKTYELFFNQNCRSQILNLSKKRLDFLSEILKNGDPFKNDFEEMRLNSNDQK